MEPSFLPAETIRGKASEATENSTVLPLFPLGAVVYTPFSEHRLNIFEPRYRAMYNDILFSGSRRFAVCTMHPDDGRFSEYATVFYLKDLKEVSEQTNDAVKFVCDHEVSPLCTSHSSESSSRQSGLELSGLSTPLARSDAISLSLALENARGGIACMLARTCKTHIAE